MGAWPLYDSSNTSFERLRHKGHSKIDCFPFALILRLHGLHMHLWPQPAK